MWLCFTLGIWTQLSSYTLGHHVNHFSVQVALKLPLSGTHTIVSTCNHSSRSLSKWCYSFNTCSIRIYIFQVSILKLHASQCPSILRKWKGPQVFCAREKKNMINMSNQVFIPSKPFHAHNTRGIGQNMQDVMLKKTKNKEVLKAGFIADLRRLGFSSRQIVFKTFDKNQ